MQGGWKPTKVRYFDGKSTAPGVGDDQNDGYQVSDIWIDETGGKSYQLVDATVGAAVWKDLTSEGTTDNYTQYLIGTGETVTLDSYDCLFVPNYVIEGTGELKIEDNAVLRVSG